MDDSTGALRLLVAAALGGLLGLERELRGQIAGLRTHILVSVGACLFTLASVWAAQPLMGAVDGESAGVRADLTRIASQVVVGIGFLGGGTILHHGTTVRGLTTAANLWVTASIGLATGLGFYSGAVVGTLIGLLALAALRPIERYIHRERRRRHAPREPDIPSHPPRGR